MARTAALWAGRAHARSKWGVLSPASAQPSGSPIDGGTGDAIGLTVEIFVNSAWTDISSFVYYKNRVKITRGKPNESSQIQPQTCTFTINNRDGRFSPRNPLGPYYLQIGRNTPVRVSRMQNGVRRFRFYGEIPSWPTQYDISGTDVFGTVTAAGQMRRLFQGNQPLRSVLYRAYGLGLGVGAGLGKLKPYAYWPCEDGQNSTLIASGLAGGVPMSLSGQALPTFAANSSFPGSLPLPLLSGSVWTGSIPAYTNPGTDSSLVGASAGLGFCMSIPATGAYDGGVLARMYTTGTIARFDLVYGAVKNGSVALVGYDSSGTQLFTSGYQSPQDFFGLGLPGYNGLPVFIDMAITPNGSTSVFWTGEFKPLYPAGPLNESFGIYTATTSGTVGIATSVVINPDGHFNDTAIGHVVFQGNENFGVGGFLINGWLFEPPTTPFYVSSFPWTQGRFLRLCQEQGVQAAILPASGVNAGDPTTMGYQPNDTFANLIQQAATTSGGLLFEARDQGSLILRERGTLYGQAAKLTLDHSQHQLSGPLLPVDDDALTRNDVTVTRIGGSSAQVVQTTGALSTAPPPAGVGDYPTNYSLSLGSDALLADQAGWRLHLGTVDQPRFPNVPINLRHPTFTSSLDMMNAALTIDIGDRLVITSPPPWMPPDPISQIVLGYSETLGAFEHDMVFNCAPEDPYKIGILEDAVLGRADTDGSTLAAAAGPADTTLTVATTTATSPPWTMNPSDFPFDVNIGGERATVTAIGCTMAGADGTFESGVSGWVPTSATFVSNSGTAYTGTKCGQLATVGSPSFAQALTSFIPVVAGVTYQYSHFVQKVTGSGLVQCDIDWYSAAHGYLSSSYSTDSVAGTAPNWAHQVLVATAPALAAYAQVGPVIQPPVAGDVVNVDNAVFGPQTFTVTRSVNGVVKAQAAGTDVRLWQPMILSL